MRREGLIAKEEKLLANVTDLTLKIGRLNGERQSQTASMEAVETQHRSVIEELMAKELALRSEIQQLQQLQVRLNETVASKEDVDEEDYASLDSRVEPPSPSVVGTDVPEMARHDGTDESEESRATSRQQSKIALEYIVREALHSGDEGSNASDAADVAGDQPQSAASITATKQLVDRSEGVQQDRRQVRHSLHMAIRIV